MNIPSSAWACQAKRTVFKHPWRSVEEWDFITPQGVAKTITVSPGGDVVIVIAETSEGDIILIKQYFFACEMHVLTTVAGMLDAHEDPMQAAERELLEETGYAASQLTALGVSVKGKYSTGRVHYFVATGAYLATDQKLEDAEDIEVCRMAFADFECALQKGQIGGTFEEAGAWRAWHYLTARPKV